MMLGPDDVIIIRAFQAEELSDKPVQITVKVISICP